MSLAQTFLTALFGEEVDELSRILIWTAPNKHSFFTRTAAEAAAHAVGIGKGQNVYFGCGLAPRNLAHYQRAERAEVRGIPGIWADIDFTSPAAHKKANLAPNLETAISLANSLPLLPTLIVLSGHGVQPWWLFKEPWMFNDEHATVERAAAADALHGWQGLLKATAAARGFEHDATHDLARVMRLPGTYNIKDPDNIVPVEITAFAESRRYNPEDFAGYLLFESALAEFQAAESMPAPAFTTPRHGVNAPPHFETALDGDAKLRLTWEKRRQTLRDSSLSAYDMALASRLAGYGEKIFSDQDIADVICAFRGKHCEEGGKDWRKGADRDYLARTIRQARISNLTQTNNAQLIDGLEEGASREELNMDTEGITEITEEVAEENKTVVSVRSDEPKPAHDERAKKILALSAILGVKINDIRCYDSEPPQYEIVLAWKTVRIGDINNFISQTEFRKVMAAGAKVVTPLFKAPKWNRICQAMLDVMTHVEVGEEGTEAGICRAWLDQYLDEYKPTAEAEVACRLRSPFRVESNGKAQIYIFLESLREWLLSRQERIDRRDLAVKLRRYGAEPVRYWVRIHDAATGEKKETTRSVYLLPGPV